MVSSRVSRTAWIVTVLALALTACAGGEPTVDEATGREPAATETAAQEPDATAATEEPAVVDAAATLSEHGGSGVSGEATLRWDPGTGVMSVALEVVGLEAGSSYLTVIASGCQPPTQRIHSLGDITGGPDGTGRVDAELDDVGTVDLDGGWVILVARPQVGPQACGELGPA